MNFRLQQFLAAENISQAQFADTIGVARASVSHIIAGRNKPGFDFLQGMMQHFPNINLEWLLTGRGKMYKTQSSNKDDIENDMVEASFNELSRQAPYSPDLFSQAEEEGETGLDIQKKEKLNVGKNVDNIKDIRQVSNINTLKNSDLTIETANHSIKISKIIVLFDDGTFQELR